MSLFRQLEERLDSWKWQGSLRGPQLCVDLYVGSVSCPCFLNTSSRRVSWLLEGIPSKEELQGRWLLSWNIGLGHGCQRCMSYRWVAALIGLAMVVNVTIECSRMQCTRSDQVFGIFRVSECESLFQWRVCSAINLFQIPFSIDGLLDMEDSTTQDLYTLNSARNASRLRAVSAVANDETVKALTEDLQEGNISVRAFLRRASYTIVKSLNRGLNGRKRKHNVWTLLTLPFTSRADISFWFQFFCCFNFQSFLFEDWYKLSFFIFPDFFLTLASKLTIIPVFPRIFQDLRYKSKTIRFIN